MGMREKTTLQVGCAKYMIEAQISIVLSIVLVGMLQHASDAFADFVS
jgi:hypothetical protein